MSQVVVQHARQSAIRCMHNVQTLQRHADSGAVEPVKFASDDQRHCLASLKRYLLADLLATYTAVVQSKAPKALSAPRAHHACINTRALMSELSVWHRKCSDMRRLALSLAQHLVMYHPGPGVSSTCSPNPHCIGAIIPVRGSYWSRMPKQYRTTLYPCIVLAIEHQHRWPGGCRSTAYRLVVVQHRNCTQPAEHERPFWMHRDCLNACVLASRSLTRQQVAVTLRSLMPLVARGRTHLQALQCMEIAVPWDQPRMLIRAYPFQDTTFHGRLHCPFVLIVDESYTGKMHPFDVHKHQAHVLVAMVVVFLKVRGLQNIIGHLCVIGCHVVAIIYTFVSIMDICMQFDVMWM